RGGRDTISCHSDRILTAERPGIASILQAWHRRREIGSTARRGCAATSAGARSRHGLAHCTVLRRLGCLCKESAALILDDVLDDLLEGNREAKPGELLELANVRDPTLEILEALGIGFVVRDVHDVGRTVDDLPHHFREPTDRDFAI